MAFEKAQIIDNNIVIAPGRKFFIDTFEKNFDNPEAKEFFALVPKDNIDLISHNNRGQVMVSFKPLQDEVKIPTKLAAKTSGYIYYYDEGDITDIANYLYGENHSGPIYFFDYFPQAKEYYKEVKEEIKEFASEGIKKATEFYKTIGYIVGGAIAGYILIRALKK